MPRKHVIVSGRVQGVGFRYYVLREAERYGVTGWVRNQYDETVEIEVQGTEAVLETFLETIRRGPAFAVVAELEVTAIPESAREKGFNVRF